MKRNVCVDLLVYLTLIFTFGLIMGCCDNLEVRSITTISDNSIENELNHASCHISQTDMESSLISFLESSDNTFRSGTKTSINLELINKEKLEKTDKTIRTVTDRIDYIDFYLYRVSSENNIKYAVTSNDLRIGSVIAVMDNLDITETDNPFWGIFAEQLEQYVDKKLGEESNIYTDRSATSEMIQSGDYSFSNWNFNSGMNNYLIKTKWSQKEPYNKIVSEETYGRGKYTGCGPVAVAQLCAYYRWPEKSNFRSTSRRRHKYDGIAYNWDEMLRKPYAYSDESIFQIALLMYELDIHLSVSYNNDGTSTARKSIADYFLKNGWEYTGKPRHSGSDNSAFKIYNFQQVKQSLDKKHPVLCAGKAVKHEKQFLGIISYNEYEHGHDWLIDGYANYTFKAINNKTGKAVELTDNFVHCNLGWQSGVCNGYYLSGVFNTKHVPLERSGEAGNYQYCLEFVYDIYHN